MESNLEKRNILSIVKGFPSFPLRGSVPRWRQSVRQAAPGVRELAASEYHRQMDVGRDDDMGCREGDRVMRGKIVPVWSDGGLGRLRR